MRQGDLTGGARLQELLTGPLTREALEETKAILEGWVRQPASLAEVRQAGQLLAGAGQWIEGWQACLEELRLRQLKPDAEAPGTALASTGHWG